MHSKSSRLKLLVVFLFILGCSQNKSDLIVDHLRNVNAFLENTSIKELGNVASNIDDCDSPELTSIKINLISLRELTNVYCDSVKSSKSLQELSMHSKHFENKLKVAGFNSSSGSSLLLKTNTFHDNFEIIKYVLMNKILLIELEERNNILSNWAIDCS